MKAYYGFKIKGNLGYFLEQFKNFQWVPEVSQTGFLGVEIYSSKYVTQNIDFPRMLENYLMVAYLNENKKLMDKLQSYQKEEKEPVIFLKLSSGNKYFKNWEEYESFLKTKNVVISSWPFPGANES